MNKLFKSFLSAVAAMLFVVSASAQITTSSMTGRIVDESGEPLTGAAVVAVHTPSGTQYYAIANAEGVYAIQGMRSGGPYTVTASFVGCQTVEYDDVTLPLGETYTQDVQLKSTNVLDEVVVMATTSKFSNEKTGAATNISSEQMSTIPTVTRNITDITRISPYAGTSTNSFAGGDGRSTNFTVDGANFNYNFGLSSSLVGGGNPISVDAIEEVQVVIAPYDVRQTNFIGGGINAITKSGTNKLKATAYAYYRNQDMRGNKVNKTELNDGVRAEESTKTYGFTIGGPIIKNKLFFFVNYEVEKTPGQVIQYRANKGGELAEGQVSRTTASDLQAVQDYMKNTYGYETGSFSSFPGDQSNTKLLARVDWNIAPGHRLSVRYNSTVNTAWNAPNGNSSDTGYRLNNTYRVGNESMAFANNMYSMDNKVKSFSFDLNDKISEKVSNQFLATYSKIDDVRGSKSSPFPHVDIIKQDDAGNWKPYMSLGYELFTWNNGVHNNVFNAKDDLTILAGSHKIMAGVSFEHQFANNAYMRNGTAYYRYAWTDNYATVVDALKGTPESFAITYGWNGELNPNAQVTFNQLGLYAQDDWKISDKFKFTYGMRFDTLIFDESDIATNKAIAEYTFRDGKTIDTGQWPYNRIQASPRFGFVWDVKGDKTLKVRGGTGLFQGRLPLVYFTNMPTNAGLVQNQVQFKSTWENGQIVSLNDKLHAFDNGMITDVETAIDKLGLQRELTDKNHVAGSTMSGVDPKFHMPQVWKTSLAVDWQVPVNFPLTVTAEAIYNKTIYGVMIDNVNVEDSASWKRFAGADDRLIYPADKGLINSGKNAPVLANTNKGYGYTGNITINATPAKNLDLMLAYTYTESKEISGLPGSDPLSTWQGLISVDGPNNAKLQRSQYVVPHKLIASVSYFVPFKIFGGKGLHVSAYYTGSSSYGNSYIYSNDMNGDGINLDLMYIPKNDSEINFTTDEDRKAFWAFVEQDSYLKHHKGQYAEAYAARSPWVNRVDLRLAEDFAFNLGRTKHNFQLVLDVANIGNMINSNWGVYKTNSISNNSAILKYEGVNSSNQPIFSMNKDKSGSFLNQSYDYLFNYAQCWKVQLGIRYLFN